ncbi:MAG TPA: hypothetical protein VFO79_16090, partial [Xanthomonadales bacterium]|nr:hypothetical protein [Xanthomonadales bacterium]
MRPRAVLLLVLLAALVLPWAGWQLVQQMEALLREGQEQAQIAAAQAISRALAASLSELPPAGPAVFVHRVPAAVLVDGSADDWFELEPARSADGRLSLALADDGDALYALIDVRDATRVRVDIDGPQAAPGDRVELTVADPHGFRTWTFGNAAPGSVQIDVGAPAIVGEWQETSEGYRVELRLPRPASPARVALRAFDETAGQARSIVELAEKDTALALVGKDSSLDRIL